jgi:hypothetical protein
MLANSNGTFIFTWDLEDIDITQPLVDSPVFTINGNMFYVYLDLHHGDFGLSAVDSSVTFPGILNFSVSLTYRYGRDRPVKHVKGSYIFYNRPGGYREFIDIKDQGDIQDYVLELVLCTKTSFSDYVQRIDPFEAVAHPFEKMWSNLSFKVGDEVVYVVQGALASRSDFFRLMFERYFTETQAPMNIDSQIPIHGIDVDVFKMIIEWIYSMDIQRLNGMSGSLLHDLERLYVAADMYQIASLRDSIERYLSHLVNHQNFGDIYQIAERIGSVSLEKFVFRKWISQSRNFNENDGQISTLVFDRDIVEDDEIMHEDEEGIEGAKDKEEDVLLFGICRKTLQASDWEGDKSSKMGVIKCLTELLSDKDKMQRYSPGSGSEMSELPESKFSRV